MSLTLQYFILGIIFLVITVWVWRKVTCMVKRKGSGCSGCALSDSCKKKELL